MRPASGRDKFADPLANMHCSPIANDRTPDRRLRIGYVSLGLLGDHACRVS